MREIRNRKSTLPLQPSGWTGPKSIAVPTSRSVPVVMLVLAELPVESSAGPVDVVSSPVELPAVVVDTLVTPGPVENPDVAASPHAARTRAPTRTMRSTWQG